MGLSESNFFKNSMDEKGIDVSSLKNYTLR